MTIEDRISSFCQLGQSLQDPTWRNQVIPLAHARNGWFTPEQTEFALNALGSWLNDNSLREWIGGLSMNETELRTVGVVMAGNIPAVGFHDMLSVLMSGHRLQAKLSSQDDVLIRSMAEELMRINPDWKSRIEFSDRLNGCDAVIATGSNNSARYFEYYFRNKPLLLRKSMSSMAVLRGDEDEKDLQLLGEDIFRYYGLGCRNVSRVLVPNDFNLDRLIGSLYPFRNILEHHKYANAYTYQRAVLLVDQQPFTDNGFCVFRETDALASPVGVLHIGRYTPETGPDPDMERLRDQLQCLVGRGHGFLPFGTTQQPRLNDYADGINTMEFLMEI